MLIICSALLAAHCPAIFSSLVLVDPIIKHFGDGIEKRRAVYDRVRSALTRRDGWASKCVHLLICLNVGPKSHPVQRAGVALSPSQPILRILASDYAPYLHQAWAHA